MKPALFLATIGILACTACEKSPNTPPTPTQTPPSQENPLRFNPKNVTTYKGQIIQIMDIFDPSTSGETLGILMQTEKGAIPVILGPRCYTSGGPRLNPGQQIAVTGSEIYVDGSILMIAQEASVEGYTLKLRNKDGNPLWSGWNKN